LHGLRYNFLVYLKYVDEIQLQQRMQQVLDLVRQDVGSIRTGRATPALVEDIINDCYGHSIPLVLGIPD